MSDFSFDDIGQIARRDLFNLVTGEELGAGSSRRVFVYAPDPTCVLKLEDTAGSFQNAMEWEFWGWAQDHPKWSKWFAPCVSISHGGSWLIQKRTRPLVRPPTKVPNFFSDFKLQNFGLYEGRPVAHDYGLGWPLNRALDTATLQPVDWWHDKDLSFVSST